MRSPFPGMDPYLESRWGDSHARLVSYIADALQPGLPNDLRARMEERVFVESIDVPRQYYVPDAHVHETPRVKRGEASGAVAVIDEPATAEPVILSFPAEITERYIEIIDASTGGRVITVIELLSPSNKLPGRGREEYLKKQQETLAARINLVEINLLRVGEHTTLAPIALVPPDKVATYHTSTYRGHRHNQIEYYPMPLRQRLPRLPIPLRPADRDVALDLQAAVDQAYDRGRYDDVDYKRPLSPPLIPAEAAWADQLLSSRAA